MLKTIEYTKHAKERIEMRQIDKTLIEGALNNPDEIIVKNEIKINHKIVGDKMLRVIFKKSKKSYIVITAYLTHKERYKGGEKI